jgi:hypothetical protein
VAKQWFFQEMGVEFGPLSPADVVENFEFFQFVGFRHAISPALYDLLVAHVQEHGLSITQVTRRALAEFLGRKDLAEDKQPDEITDAGEAQEVAEVDNDK